MIKKNLKEMNITLPEGFSAGFGREVVNPVEGIGLSGYGSEAERVTTDVMDDICVTCTALSDGEEVVLLYSSDTLCTSRDMLLTVAKIVGEKFGIPEENIIFNSTHTHAGPGMHRGKACPGLDKYAPIYYGAVETITERALRDLAPSTAYVGMTDTESMNWVRRYVSTKDGSFLGNWMRPARDPEDARHETPADSRLQVIRFAREEKKDIVLVNWQCHPCSTGVAGQFGTKISPDWVAPMRNLVEEMLDVHCSYHQGACGNLVSGTGILCEKSNDSYKRKGRELCYYIRRALEGAFPVATDRIRLVREEFPGVFSQAYKEKSGEKRDVCTLYLTTLAIGDIAFATVPCEWHDTCGRSVREGSPFQMTFICGYSNGAYSYIPAAFCWNNGGYEVNKCFFERGTGEQIAQHHIDVLRKLYGETQEK